jgi:NADPH:quinone reductase
MLAIQVSQVGGPEVLTLVELPLATPQPGEAIVQIKAAGVNFIDVYFREGRYPAPLPFINGQEAAGIVTSVGSEVRNVKPGDRVAYTGVRGSYAEYAAVPADRLVAIPDQVDFETAAAAMLQGMTAHYLSHSTYAIQGGDTVLIHAAAGGVGLLLVQMAKRLGARVIGTAGNSDKAQLARAAGADEAIIYSEQDFESETKRLTNNEGVHVVYDGVAAARLSRPVWRRQWRRASLRSNSTFAKGLALFNSPESASLHSHARRTGAAFWRCPENDSSW